ncbi:FACT complex subunit SPT16 [Thraustotheca clavata]|uniref:FACT complex subunit n=1 Tax=Thraustotheca clavata TaxID=74557 RepID=A0A1V9ZVA5_9STRA|nr:FACT complex subunit SPT16 [Thraustotheca clavata]
MSDEPQLNKELFYRRLANIYASWKEAKGSEWGDPAVDAFCVLAGKPNPDDSGYRKSAIMQFYLLGFLEFPETLMIFTKTTLYVLTSGRKYSMLEAIQDGNATSEIKLELLKRDKSDGNKANYDKILQAIQATGKRLGVIAKENPEGDLVQNFMKEVDASGMEKIDIAKGIEAALRIKASEEMESIRWAAALTKKIFQMKFIEDMESIIDEDKSVKQDALSNQIESIYEDPSKIKLNLNPEDIESCYSPIIQSGGVYDLRPSAQSNSAPMKFDVIIASLGSRFKGYCSNVARTFFITPIKSMERSYQLLFDAHELCISELRPGKKISAIVDKVTKFIESKNPKLAKLLTKNFGFGIGLDFRESSMLLSAKNHHVVQVGQTFNVAIGFQNIPLSESRPKHLPETYSIMLADTVAVMENITKVWTKVPKEWSKIHYDIDDDEQSKAPKESKKKELKKVESAELDDDEGGGVSTRNNVLQSRLRDQQRALEGKETDQERRERHQAELMKRKREEAMRRLEEQSSDAVTGKRTDKHAIVAYNHPSQYPEIRPRQVSVDMRHEAVIVPINGVAVPFHISTIKNVSKSEEDKATYLRINFHCPGVGGTLGKDASPAMQAIVAQFPSLMFIKELGFRSTDAHNLNNQFRLIKELQKRVKQREQQEQEESDLVIQEDLILTRDRRVPRLSDLSARPHLSGRKTTGTLEAHQNGLRFTTNKNQKLDILYANIKHAIFQPCDNELVVLIHFHLKHHIMIGKKKHRDVQFYTEVIESSQALDNRRRSMYDPDELDEESRERALREKLNTTFKDFCQKVESVSERVDKTITFDIPYRELGFSGTPFKEMVLLQPTVHCLVSLTEFPFFITLLDDVEHVHFERVFFGSKNFDMVFIHKNFDIVPVRVSAISTQELERIKEWLDDIDICFTEGTANLNWKQIMVTIKADDRFYLDTDDDGVPKPAGWEFLKMDGSDDEDDGSQEDESEFEAASDVEEDDDDESEDSDDSDSEVSLVDEGESDDDGSEEEEEEDGPSWEELEKEARASDMMRHEKQAREEADSDEEYRRKTKKKSSSSSSKHGGPPAKRRKH